MPKGQLGEGYAVALTPERCGWNYSGLVVLDLTAGESFTREFKNEEVVVLPLSAENLSVRIGQEEFKLAGRIGVFSAITDWVYATVGSTITITTPTGGQVALATARAELAFPTVYTPASEVPVYVRGAGNATRQVVNYVAPDNFVGAHRIVLCEILAPGGNWSSYPPHRHDGIADCPYTNEEIYYFRIANGDSPHGDPTGFGFHRTFTAPEDPGVPVEFDTTVRDGDVAIVPRGYHGPCVSAPGYPMYYLNILAGPGERTFGFCDDPAHHWVRATWDDAPRDPRVPLYGHENLKN